MLRSAADALSMALSAAPSCAPSKPASDEGIEVWPESWPAERSEPDLIALEANSSSGEDIRSRSEGSCPPVIVSARRVREGGENEGPPSRGGEIGFSSGTVSFGVGRFERRLVAPWLSQSSSCCTPQVTLRSTA